MKPSPEDEEAPPAPLEVAAPLLAPDTFTREVDADPAEWFSRWDGPWFTRPAVLLALIIAVAGTAKVIYENAIDREQLARGYRIPTPYVSLTSKLGQGMMVGLLAGLRSCVADYYWRDVTDAFSVASWYKVKSSIETATTLQPQNPTYWDMGGWQMAWNASSWERYGRLGLTEAQKLKNYTTWVDAGEDLLLRGIHNVPDSYKLHQTLGNLYDTRKIDHRKSAEQYKLAASMPDAPSYLKRFPGYQLQKAGDDQAAYDYFKELWAKKPAVVPPGENYEKVETEMRKLETKLKVPAEKRVFPK